MSGDFIEERRVWNYETLRQDHSKSFISRIEKYDGFCSVPDHINYQRSIGTFLNQYEPISYQQAPGDCPQTLDFLRHIFGEQLEMGLKYLQLLYTQPLIRLPILLFVSVERNTAKTTFLNFLKAIFAGNMTFNTNEDFHSQFNSDWAHKLIVGVDEALRKIITHNRGKIENEMFSIISDLMQIQDADEYQFSVNNMLDMLKRNSVQAEAGHIRKILQDKWKLQPKAPTYYTAHIFGFNGEILSVPNQVARILHWNIWIKWVIKTHSLL